MRPIALAVLCCLGLLGGCAQPRYSLENCLPPEVSSPEETVQSLRYRVKSDAGRAGAQEVSRFMERAAGLWSPVFGVPDPSALPLEIQLHRDPAAMQELLVSRDLTPTATGLYLPLSPPAIHVACWGKEPGHPYRTLLHEGTHQFAHLATGYRATGDVVNKAPPAPRLAIPLWLSEGLATYFEAAFLDTELLVPGTPDPDRLSQLQTALRKGRVPCLDQVLTARYGEKFDSLDYAAAWALVHALLQEEPPPWAAGGREWLIGVLAEARVGWPGAAVVGPATANYDPWWGLVTVAVRQEFMRFVEERGMTFPQWESAWRKWVLAQP